MLPRNYQRIVNDPSLKISLCNIGNGSRGYRMKSLPGAMLSQGFEVHSHIQGEGCHLSEIRIPPLCEQA